MTMSAIEPLAAPVLSLSSLPVRAPIILVVDDDRVTMAILSRMLEKFGYSVRSAGTGEEALKALRHDVMEIDAVILDREMPGMTGIKVMEVLRSDPQMTAIPVIMHTSAGSPEQIQQGIDAGVFYYLAKPADEKLLKSIITSALRERQQRRVLLGEIGRHDAALKSMRSCQMAVKSLKDAEDAACFLAACFPHPARVANGLLELLTNAVEHGNLGITYEEKEQLLINNHWQKEIRRRLAMPEHADKEVDVIYQHKPDMWLVQITDRGTGFDWRRYWQIDPARATASHGRGIARARLTAFDRLAYNTAGNQVTAIIQASPAETLEW
ncbi:MAG: response regulator [Alphaproteobacteria bacterium]|nr:response regulator [Alphaproteobacteria bacterium]